MIQVILLWKIQALAQTLRSVRHMGNKAGTYFLRASSSRFGLSEGFLEDWCVNFHDHHDSCIGPGSWEVLCELCTSLRIPLVIMPLRVNTQKFGKAGPLPRKWQILPKFVSQHLPRPAASGSLGYAVLQRKGNGLNGAPGSRAS